MAVSCPSTARHGTAWQGSPLRSAGWGVCTWLSPKEPCREHLASCHGSGVFGHGCSFPAGSNTRSLAQAGGGAPGSSHPAPPSTAVPTHPSPSCITATSPFSPGCLQLISCRPLLPTPPALVSAPSSCAVPRAPSLLRLSEHPGARSSSLQCSQVSRGLCTPGGAHSDGSSTQPSSLSSSRAWPHSSGEPGELVFLSEGCGECSASRKESPRESPLSALPIASLQTLINLPLK